MYVRVMFPTVPCVFVYSVFVALKLFFFLLFFATIKWEQSAQIYVYTSSNVNKRAKVSPKKRKKKEDVGSKIRINV